MSGSGSDIGGLVSLLYACSAVSEWNVAYAECPVLMASNMTSASFALLISPTIILSGRIRSELARRSSMLTPPWPSGFGSLAEKGIQ